MNAKHSILIANQHIIIADAEGIHIIPQQAIDSCDGHHFIGSGIIRKQAVFCQAIDETTFGTNHTSDLIIRVKRRPASILPIDNRRTKQ